MIMEYFLQIKVENDEFQTQIKLECMTLGMVHMNIYVFVSFFRSLTTKSVNFIM